MMFSEKELSTMLTWVVRWRAVAKFHTRSHRIRGSPRLAKRMHNFLLCILTVAASVIMTFASTCMSKEAFADYCTNKLIGAVNGGRCYFVSNTKATWDDAWTQCQSQGGVGLAQIHTSSEMTTITNYMKKALGGENFVWVAHKRDDYAPKCWIDDEPKSGWYSDASTPVPNLLSKNTWVRTREKDDCFWRQGQCNHIWTSYTKFGDWNCNDKLNAVCMAVNPNQDYNLTPGTCLTEVPIVSSSAATATDCSVKCNDQGTWCRSFNYHTDSSTCELFSWAIDDNPGTANIANCVQYTYLP